MLIDEKGRLFGKINIVDFAFIILLIALVVGLSKGCNKIAGIDKSVYDKIRYDVKEEEIKRVNSELAETRANTNKRDKMAEDMLNNQRVWYEGFKEGFSAGYSTAIKEKGGAF